MRTDYIKILIMMCLFAGLDREFPLPRARLKSLRSNVNRCIAVNILFGKFFRFILNYFL